MPIFEYRCEKCGEEFERLVPKADAKVHCEKCGIELELTDPHQFDEHGNIIN